MKQKKINRVPRSIGFPPIALVLLLPRRRFRRVFAAITKPSQAKIHLYRRGKGPIDVFKPGLCEWDQNELEIGDILDKYDFKSFSSTIAPVGQARMSEKYAAPYTTSTLICLMASIQCGIIGFCANHNISAWLLTPGIRALSSIYWFVISVVRSDLIVMGLCAVLWGKNKEMNAKNNVEEDREEDKQEVVKSDLEMQFKGLSNGNHNLHTIKS